MYIKNRGGIIIDTYNCSECIYGYYFPSCNADLKKEVPEVKSRQFVYNPSTYMCAATDFTIVTGGENGI